MHIHGLELNTWSTSRSSAQIIGHFLGHFGIYFKEVEVGIGKTGDELGIGDKETQKQHQCHLVSPAILQAAHLRWLQPVLVTSIYKGDV